jgi:hypothetical protein
MLTKNQQEAKVFITELINFGAKTSHLMSPCERYGMTWGCEEACPVWQKGECDNEDTLKQSEREGWRKYEEN